MKTLKLLIISLLSIVTAYAQNTPNVILIYADDIGYGDLSCYYPANKLKTPNVDKLAAEGLKFNRVYSSSATCTPSRFSLLTGQYPFRKTGTGVLPGDATALIRKGTPTLANVFKNAGYQTAVVGKWHLGLGDDKGPEWNGTLSQTPNDIGFDYSFIMAATGDRVPTVYVENRRVVGLDPQDPIIINYKTKVGNEPTGRENPELLKMKHSHGHDFTIVNGVGRIGYMTGGHSARWIDEDMADIFVKKANDFIVENKNRPFFLYFATHDIHVPRLPHERFLGRSGHGPRGDALLEFDDSVGQLIKTLQANGLLENTMIILTSDNGPVVDDGYQDQAVELLGSHKPSGDLRGGKYSIFEAGTRMPMIVWHKNHIQAGESNALISQVDLPASMAAMLGQKSYTKSFVDSKNMFNALIGKDKKGRKDLVTYTQAGGLALIEKRYKYISPSNSYKYNKETNTEMGNDTMPQLYDLINDFGEKNNLASMNTKKVEAMHKRLTMIKEKAN